MLHNRCHRPNCDAKIFGDPVLPERRLEEDVAAVVLELLVRLWQWKGHVVVVAEDTLSILFQTRFHTSLGYIPHEFTSH